MKFVLDVLGINLINEEGEPEILLIEVSQIKMKKSQAPNFKPQNQRKANDYRLVEGAGAAAQQAGWKKKISLKDKFSLL